MLYVLGALLLSRLIRWITARVTEHIEAGGTEHDKLIRSEAAKHRHALAQVISWTILVLVYSATAILIIQAFGLPLAGFVAPATVAGVALGFGAQGVVHDLLAGFFVITERQYGFGDLTRMSVIGVSTPVLGTVAVVRSKAHLGATVTAAGVSQGQAFIVEALIAFLLVFVIMSVATDIRVPAALAAASIGFALVAAVLIGGGITGGAVNPDRALGPAIMSGTFTSLWVYVAAELLGGIVASLLDTHVVIRATAAAMEHGDPQAQRPAGDRGLATATDT